MSQDCYIGYVRVSSTEQAERNISIPSQIDQIQQYAQKHNVTISKIYKEEHSAFKGTRTIFHQMLKDLEKMNRWWVIVFKMDRISRNPEDFMALEKIVKKKWLDIISVTEPMMNNYLGRYMYRDMQNRAILYSEELSFRTKLGMRKKLQMWWSLWWTPPFGFKVINKKFEADESKSEIVKFIFSQYATAKYGYKEIAKQVKEQWNVPKFHWKNVYHTLINTHYIGYKTKERKLSKEECFLWWYDKAGTYTETYHLNYITPFISQELFDRCKIIREWRATKLWPRSSTIKHHHNFYCHCGRKLRREDKKNNSYLRCSKYQSSLFPDCKEPVCINLKLLVPQLEEILDKVIPSRDKTYQAIADIAKQLEILERDREELLVDYNIKKSDLVGKTEELTESFLEWRLSKQIFEISMNKVQCQLNDIQTQITTLENFDRTRAGYLKTIQVLESLDKYYVLRSNTTKSSPIFELGFATLANLFIQWKKVHTYAPSSLFQYTEFWQDSLVGRSTGIEPATLGTTTQCSTNWATTDIKIPITILIHSSIDFCL